MVEQKQTIINLQMRRQESEAAGWQISEDFGEWQAVKKFPGEIYSTIIKSTNSLADVLGLAERADHQNASAKYETVNNVVEIEVKKIIPSTFEPQLRRRRKFKEEDIEALADSIRKHGLAQPILVRRVKSKFEIVFGERRFLAVKKNGADKINCFARALTDAQVLELQYEENHRRMDNTALDDAFFFKFLMEKENYSEEELSDRLNTTIKNVRDKLILNNLIPEAAGELSEERLPLKHAYFLARFPPDTQKLIAREQYAYKYHDREEKAASFQTFVSEVEENITRKLKNAPFSTIDERLHIKKLICPNCPERTGFAPALFADLTPDDACLNRSCFEIKTNTHLRLKREEIAAQLPNANNAPIEQVAREVPLVSNRDWTDKTPFDEKTLLKQEFLDEPECIFSEISLIVEGAEKGQETYICREKTCEVHHPPKAVSDSETEKKEALFERKVEQLTREKIFAKSIEFFTDYKPLWMFDDLVQRLIFELWNSTGFDTRKTVILRLIKNWKNAPRHAHDADGVKNFIASLDKTRQSQLIFLLIFQTEGFYQNAPQDGIKQIAADYAGVDYRLLKAEAGVELAAPEDMELAEDLLTATKFGLNLIRPPDHDLGDTAQ